ncbi:MAG: hypothetical protein FJZ67_11720 [Bacteroidetes bacterium]|nr:hypothetical protein [Bacteroidota bacterium]
MEVQGSLSVFNEHEIAHRLKDHLMNKLPGIADVHIQVEPVRMKE